MSAEHPGFFWQRWPLPVKITLTVTFLISGAIIAITALSLQREQQAFQAGMEEQAHMLLESLAVSQAPSIERQDTAALSVLGAELVARGAVQGIGFYDRQGNPIVRETSLPPGLTADIGQQILASPETIVWWESDRLVSGRAVTQKGMVAGGLHIELALNPMDQNLQQAWGKAALGAFITLALGSAGAVLVSRTIAGFMLEATEYRQTEIALRQTHETLEQRVEERTAALAKANAALQVQMQELERTEQALRESEERYILATRGANDGLWDWDMRSERVYFSQRWKSILGYLDGEVGSHVQDWFNLIHNEDQEQVKADLSNHLDGLSPHFESEHRMRHKDGTFRWVLNRGLVVRDSDGRTYRMAGSLSDITERKQVEEQLQHDAFHDALTGLPNRGLFMDRLGRAIERNRRRSEYLFAVLFLDLDRFKVINDSLGHTIGDKLLIDIARRLEFFLRKVDTVARLGGDEFVILLEEIESPEDATRVAERIQDELTLPFFPNDHKVFTSVSIGIVLSTTGYDRPEEVLRDADIALYRAKAKGRARYEVFNTEMRADAMARLELETGLRRAIGFQEFKVFYQPIIALENDRITGFEALVRWQHPERGLIQPEEFIGVAEETGLIIPIDWLVLREACRQLAAWQKQYPVDPPLTISVNVSSKHFTGLDLVSQIENILQATGLSPESLKLEITESVFMESEEIEPASIARLRGMGIQLQIDDFGTGYSSLGYLQRFPIDTIKIDRTFVSKMDQHVTNSEIVRTIVNLARELNMDAIAEGVETEAQLNLLRELACEFGQGFLISRPIDQNQASEIISDMLAGKPLSIFKRGE